MLLNFPRLTLTHLTAKPTYLIKKLPKVTRNSITLPAGFILLGGEFFMCNLNYIKKTRLFKYIEKNSQKLNIFRQKNTPIFFKFLLKT